MAPQSHVVVTLRLPSELLKPFDFSECKALGAKKRRRPAAKPRSKAIPAVSAKAEAGGEDDGEELDVPVVSKRLASVEPRGSAGSGIISGGGGDPILGNLPRSVKAAPVANTSGLDLDKTPCRKWTRRPIVWKSFTGFTYNVTAWCSDYSKSELEAKLKRELELERSGDKEKPSRTTKRSAVTKATTTKTKRPKLEPDAAALTREGSEQQEETPDVEQDAISELASDLPSEPPSDAAIQLPSAPPSELPSELA